MGAYSFENVCIFHILDGLRDGLSHFGSPTRVALLYCIEPGGKPYLWDPQDLLRGHEPKLQEFYLYSNKWRKDPPDGVEIDFLDEDHYRALDMAGIIAFGGRSRAVAYQMWFTEHQPDICSTGPIKRWLEYAVRLFAQNYEMHNVMNIDTAGQVLQQCAVHAVRDHIVDERSLMGRLDTQLRIYPVLDAVLGVSRTLEEGRPPRGAIAFVEPCTLYQMNFMAMFDDQERPQLDNFKHVRKMLQCVEGSDRLLVSDGRTIAGVATGTPPDDSVVARFLGSHGFLSLNGLQVCSFFDGGFHASNRKPILVQLEEWLLDSKLDRNAQNHLFHIATALVGALCESGRGGAMVLDLNPDPLPIPGQHLVYPLPLGVDRFLDLAEALAQVDGALHIGPRGQLYAFACLLDGHSVPGENRARGARFNSALRFSAEHENMAVVVVSSDRPVSVMQGGVELTARCQWIRMSGRPHPPTLQDWIMGGGMTGMIV